jgi:hypothetical protein
VLLAEVRDVELAIHDRDQGVGLGAGHVFSPMGALSRKRCSIARLTSRSGTRFIRHFVAARVSVRIDALAVAAGETLWVGGRSVNEGGTPTCRSRGGVTRRVFVTGHTPVVRAWESEGAVFKFEPRSLK